MGATNFYDRIKGTDSQKAFKELREHACYESGNGGYTGTIAEKSDYTMSFKPKHIDADQWIEMIEEFDPDNTSQEYHYFLKEDFDVYDDKWGDALCIRTDNGFIFCGCASC